MNSVELAQEQVRVRVAEGGHHIPAETITRRYYAGIRNFVHLYQQLADCWLLFDNSTTAQQLIAESRRNGETIIVSANTWNTFNQLANHDAHGNQR